MNTMIELSRTSEVLFSLHLRNKKTGDQVNIDVHWPVIHRHFSEVTGRWGECLLSKVVLNGSENIVAGDSLPQIVQQATDFIRRQIADNAAQEWEDEHGVASWVLLPKTIPIGWGYELYKRLSDLVASEEAKFVEQVDKRRRAHEAKKGTRRSAISCFYFSN